MSALTDFFLNSTRADVQLELLEISHPNFSKTYYICRNHRDGVTVTLEDSSVKFFQYLPTKITKNRSTDDLDTGLQVSFGDLGQLIPQELDRIEAADNFKVYPTCKYRTYSSNDLTVPLLGPFTFQIKAFTDNRKGATFQATAPVVNANKTGELYRIDRFPMLRGFIA